MLKSKLLWVFILPTVFFIACLPEGKENSTKEPSSESEMPVFSLANYPPGTDLALGEKLFRSQCGTCHHHTMTLTAPPLAGSWEKFSDDREFFYAFIKDEMALVESGNQRAIELSNWGPATMLPYPDLTELEIASVSAYSDQQAFKKNRP